MLHSIETNLTLRENISFQNFEIVLIKGPCEAIKKFLSSFKGPLVNELLHQRNWHLHIYHPNYYSEGHKLKPG
jgi:hypothetical protein